MYGLGNIASTVNNVLNVRRADGLGKLPPMNGKAGNAFVIDYVPLSEIYTDESSFQNRGDKYSEKSVKSIIDAVANGSFNWFAFDPVILWENPADGKKYVLSGHSRTQAFRQLSKMHPEWIVDGLSFTSIPARVYRGSFEDAKRLALNSNTLATPETLTERAAYYRRIRERQGITKGKDLKALKDKALRENNGQMIWDLSYLPDGGISFDSLKAFKLGEESGSTENFLRLATICQWIGKAFQIYKGLSKAHDRELFNFLMSGGYGSKSGQYFNFTSLNDRLQKLYAKNVADDRKVNANGEYTEPFQIAAYKKDDATLDTLDTLKKDADGAYKELKRKLKELRDNNATREQIFEIATPYFNGWANALYDWWSLLDRTPKTDNAPSLFGLGKSDITNNDVPASLDGLLCGIFGVDGLGKPTIKFEFNSNDELKDFLRENKENLINSWIDVEAKDADTATVTPDVLTPKRRAKSLNGIFTVNDKPASVFNCPESMLQCKGFAPTYQRLADYSHLIDTADGAKTLKGYGFEQSTLKELINACKHYKQVERLAAHLKDKDPLQSAFNVWHWEHCNLNYNYDTPGEEEIRTPARVWADRKSGVDCDCLAVFTACLFLCMGYRPKFEIVAFNGSDKYSHIYVNLDGAAVDRVLPVFLVRPSMITKTKIMDIPVYELSGLDGASAILHGVYSSTLSKIFTHTATPEESLNFRKTQVLITLQGADPNGYRLGALLMPHVTAIGDDGAYYFENEEIANIAADSDQRLRAMEMRGVSAMELNGFFKKIGKKIANAAKKVVKSTAKVVTTAAKAVANTTKAAVKSTVNAVKATANVVKAGAQAVTGNTKAAKATMQKAGQQAKSAVVDPLKTEAKNTVAVTKAVASNIKTVAQVTIVNPMKETIKIAGKLFKVILVKLNPLMVLIRNSIRLLIAINFLGMATRFNVGMMTEAEAVKAGWSKDVWEKGKEAVDKMKRLFKKLGGDVSKLEKSIRNGSKKKALFKKDIKPNARLVETSDTDATLSGTAEIAKGINGLGAAATLASALAAAGAFLAKIWGWIKNIVKAVVPVAQTITAFTGGGKQSGTADGNGNGNANAPVVVTSSPGGGTTDGGNKNKTIAIIGAAVAAVGIGAAVALGGGKKKKRRK